MSSYPGQTSCGCPYINHRDPSKHWSECHYRLNSERDNPQSSTAEPVQGDAVGWFTEDHMTDKSATTYDPVVAVRWRKKGWPVTPLYTSPAKPDAEMVELRALLAGTNYSASGDCHNARVVAAAIARIDAKLAERVGSP